MNMGRSDVGRRGNMDLSRKCIPLTTLVHTSVFTFVYQVQHQVKNLNFKHCWGTHLLKKMKIRGILNMVVKISTEFLLLFLLDSL